MKVALVCPYDLGRFGGVQDQVTKLSRWLGQAGHDAWIVGPGQDGPEGSRLVGPITEITANGSETPISLDRGTVAAVKEAIADADVVHVHEPFMPMVSLAAMTARTPPVVATFHADPSTGVRFAYRVMRPLLSAVLRRAAVVTAVSPVAAGALPNRSRVRVVPNGIDTTEYRDGVAPLAMPGSGTGHRVAFIGRDDQRKGRSILLDAWQSVIGHVPDAELVIIGSSDPGGHPPSVRFTGRIEEDEKRSILLASDVFCAPNTGGESFGIVLVEAMAAGCAVVASALQGFVFVTGGAALHVKPGDAPGLAGALRVALDGADRRTALQRAGLERVQRFDRAAVLAGYVDAYETAADGRSR